MDWQTGQMDGMDLVMMPLQLFGTIETAQGLANAMLCIDADRPTEYVIHTYGSGIDTRAIVTHVVEQGETLELSGTGMLLPSQNGALYYPVPLAEHDLAQLQAMRATLTRTPSGLVGHWTSLGGTGGAIRLSELKAALHVSEQCADWGAFKSWTSRVRHEIDATLFRGHGRNQFRLQTTLHRAGRHRLERYCAETLAQFHSKAEGVLGMRLNMQDGWDYSTVLGLAQHHSLPTPLLDWTESPYVAAFFAFADALENEGSRPDGESVRIYALARHFVENTSPPVVVLPVAEPYAYSLSISGRLNARLQSQQGHFLVTNVANLESWLVNIESAVNKPTLRSIEVPARFAREALEDLAFMGLSAATLFPGLDGVCRAIRHSMSFARSPVPMPGLPADSASLDVSNQPAAQLSAQTLEDLEGGDSAGPAAGA